METGITIDEVRFFSSDSSMAIALAVAVIVGVAVFLAIARPRFLFGARRSGGPSGRKLGLFAAVLCCVVVLIAPIVLAIQNGDVLATIPLLGVRVLQAIVLDNGFVDYIAGLPQGGLALAYYFLIGLGYIALPLLAALNVYGLLVQRLSALNAWRLANISASGKNVFLFNGLNSNAFGLAKDVLANDERALVVFSSMSKLDLDAWSTEIAAMDSNRARFLETGYSDMAIDLCRKFKFETLSCFAITGNSARDISDTCFTIERLRGGGDVDSRKTCNVFLGPQAESARAWVRLYATYDSADDERVVDAANDRRLVADGDVAAPPLQVVLLNEAAMASYALLREAPLFEVLDARGCDENGLRPQKPAELDVLIIGSGAYAEELMKAVLWCGQMHNVVLSVEVAAPDAEALRGRALIRYPELAKSGYFNLTFTQVEVQSPEFDEACLEKYVGSKHLYIISALEDDAVSHEMAMHTRLFYLSRGMGSKEGVAVHPFVSCLIRDEAMSALISTQFDEEVPSYGIFPFGCSKDLFSYRGVVDSPLEKSGQIANRLYNALYDGIADASFTTGDIDVGVLRENVERVLEDAQVLSMDPGGYFGGIGCLPQIQRFSNLSLALHARYKAWALCDSVPSDEACAILGKNEHDRWTVFYQTQGFSYMSYEEQEMFSRELTGKNTRRKIEPLYRHTLMCPNDDVWDNYLHAVGGFSYEAQSEIENGTARVSVLPIDNAGEPVAGIKVQLLDENYGVIEEWTSDTQAHEVSGLSDGHYILHPASAMPECECAADLAVEVEADVDREEPVLLPVQGKSIVNPVIYDWAFAIAVSTLAKLTD